MKIKFIGTAGARVYGHHRWDADNRFTADVDAATALELLTYPTPQFVVAEGDGFAAVTGDDLAVYLMAGIGSLEELAGLKKADVAALAETSGMSADSIMERVKTAQNLLKEA